MQVLDKIFEPYITQQQISERIEILAKKINEDYVGKNPFFLCILNGSFMFASDLYKNITLPSQISFVKLASYSGTKSTEKVINMIGLDADLFERDVIIVEDIVDTGKTLHTFLPTLQHQQPKSIAIATLLHKPEALVHPLDVKYIGFNIPNKFVVGYGLDYNSFGRNLKEIYQIVE